MEVIHSTQMYIPLKPLFSKHKGVGVQFTDEPTGNLDQKNTEEIVKSFQKMNHQFGLTIIMVTHDEAIARQCDRTLYMKDGKIV